MVTNGNGNGNNGNSKKREDTCQRIIKALGESAGLLTLAAKKAGVSYTTINRYAHDFISVQAAIQEAKESMLDFTEGKLYEKIKGGDTASILFYLKTQGKARGYTERQELTGADGGNLKVEIDGKSALLSAIARIAARTETDSSDKQP